MANTPQAKKRIRRNDRRAEINGARVGRIRTFVKKVESAIAGGDKSAAADALREAQPEMARGIARGVSQEHRGAQNVAADESRCRSLIRGALLATRLQQKSQMTGAMSPVFLFVLRQSLFVLGQAFCLS